MEATSKILVAGYRGLVGSAITRRLESGGFTNIVKIDRGEVDLTKQADTLALFERERPEFVFLAAARVGGIHANDAYAADFIRDNLFIQNNVIDASLEVGVAKLLFLGSSCIYPKLAPQPIKEEYLLTGPLEPTNQWYAIAKIAGIKLVQAYRKQHGFCGVSVMPTNLYGPGDNFDPARSHVLPALIRRFYEAQASGARTVTVWGSGSPRREFLHVDDLADAVVFVMEKYDDDEIINIGVGEDVTIRELAEMVREVVGFTGELEFDSSKPDGTPRKLLDVSRLNALGWRARIPLRQGIASTCAWFREAFG